MDKAAAALAKTRTAPRGDGALDLNMAFVVIGFRLQAASAEGCVSWLGGRAGLITS